MSLQYSHKPLISPLLFCHPFFTCPFPTLSSIFLSLLFIIPSHIFINPFISYVHHLYCFCLSTRLLLPSPHQPGNYRTRRSRCWWWLRSSIASLTAHPASSRGRWGRTWTSSSTTPTTMKRMAKRESPWGLGVMRSLVRVSGDANKWCLAVLLVVLSIVFLFLPTLPIASWPIYITLLLFLCSYQECRDRRGLNACIRQIFLPYEILYQPQYSIRICFILYSLNFCLYYWWESRDRGWMNLCSRRNFCPATFYTSLIILYILVLYPSPTLLFCHLMFVMGDENV